MQEAGSRRPSRSRTLAVAMAAGMLGLGPWGTDASAPSRPLQGGAGSALPTHEHDHGPGAPRARTPGTGGGGSSPAPLSGGGAVAPVRYPIVPIGGTFDGDVLTGLFVDVDPAPGVLHSYSCDPFTYDGHNGVDLGLRSFEEKRIGVPVFAAEDGVVTYVYDDDPDENTFPQGQNNIVAVAHAGSTIESQYFHLATDSADAAGIAVGTPVVAGQQIGRVGSSGASFGPHLHFENRLLPGFALYDPFTGPCNPGPSGWQGQPPLSSVLELTDFGVSAADFFDPATPFFPEPPPRQGLFSFAEVGSVTYWIAVRNLPAGAVIDERFYRPDGSFFADASFSFPIGYAELAKNDTRWFPRWLEPIAGTWRLEVRIDGQLLVDAPIEVASAPDPGFNRPPEAIGAALDPPAPGGDDVVFCRVQGSLVLDDLDWDVVRYRYVWDVDGAVVRDVVSAGRGDALERGTAAPGDTVTCSVTPGDGTADGAPAVASAPWGSCGGGAPDADGDGVCDAVDNCPYASNPGQQDAGGKGNASPPDGIGDACQCGDVNGDGRVTLADAVVVARSLLNPPTATRTRPELCDVGGPPSAATQNCTLADAVLMRRALLSPPTAQLAQACDPATP